MIKKFMIRCDMEGCSGITSYSQTDPGSKDYQNSLPLLMSDLLAAIRGLNEGGANEIIIYDEHFYGLNIDLTALPSNVSVICGKPPYTPEWAGGLDKTFTGMILLGLHAKRNTINALLNHTYEPEIKDLRINHLSVGEIGMESAIAGQFQVPLILVCGDSAAVKEAYQLNCGTSGVIVKDSITGTGAQCFSLCNTSSKIQYAAFQVAQATPPTASPLKFTSPITLEIDFDQGPYLNSLLDTYPDLFSSNNSITIQADTILDAWSEYWKIKLEIYHKLNN